MFGVAQAQNPALSNVRDPLLCNRNLLPSKPAFLIGVILQQVECADLLLAVPRGFHGPHVDDLSRRRHRALLMLADERGRKQKALIAEAASGPDEGVVPAVGKCATTVARMNSQ